MPRRASNSYRRLPQRPGRPAAGEIGSLAQELAILDEILELQREMRLPPEQHARRHVVVRALHVGTEIPLGHGGEL